MGPAKHWKSGGHGSEKGSDGAEQLLRENGAIGDLADTMLAGINPEIADQITKEWKLEHHRDTARRERLALRALRVAYSLLGESKVIEEVRRLERG